MSAVAAVTEVDMPDGYPCSRLRFKDEAACSHVPGPQPMLVLSAAVAFISAIADFGFEQDQRRGQSVHGGEVPIV